MKHQLLKAFFGLSVLPHDGMDAGEKKLLNSSLSFYYHRETKPTSPAPFRKRNIRDQKLVCR